MTFVGKNAFIMLKPCFTRKKNIFISYFYLLLARLLTDAYHWGRSHIFFQHEITL